jgi:hypothetical protein
MMYCGGEKWIIVCAPRRSKCVCDRSGREKDRFVVFLHVDLRSDGLIAAAGCYWIQGGASECRMASQ